MKRLRPVTDWVCARYTAVTATSSAVARRCSGMRSSIAAMYLGSAPAREGEAVSSRPGAMALTRMPWGAHSIASMRVIWMIAPLEMP
jgi:hypothetical protein